MRNFISYILTLLLVFGAVSCSLAQQPRIGTDPEFESTINKPARIVKIKDGHYLIDFGKAFFGTVILKPKQSQNDTLIVHVGEKLSGTNLIDRNPQGTIRYNEVKVGKLLKGKTIKIELVPDLRNSNIPAILLPDSFGVVMPFRYCELENLQIPIDEIETSQLAYHYKFNDEASSFTSSDTILNQIWDLCKHTIKATSFAGYYVDGDRERIPYEADAYINQLSHYSFDHVYSLARRTNAYFIDHPTWPTEWLLHTVMLFYQDFMYTGDSSMLKRYYEDLKLRTLMDLEREDGLISSKSENLTGEFKVKLGFENPKTNVRDIVDWPPAQKDTGWKLATAAGERDGYEMAEINTVVNSFYYHNLCLMSEIAGYLGKAEDTRLFQQKSKQVKEAFNQMLFNNSRGIYVDGEGSKHASLHANMLPLAFDLVPEENIKTVTKHIKTRGMACSVYGAQYLLEGLYKANEPEYALKLMNDTTHDRTWWNMLKIGSTMTLEAWDAKYKPNLDWNHAWGTAPANIITRYMWGITPKEPGFISVLIKPQLDGLGSSSITVPTIIGAIQAEYKQEKHTQRYKIELPDGMEGEFVLPDVRGNVLFNGESVAPSELKIRLKSGLNKLRIRSRND